MKKSTLWITNAFTLGMLGDFIYRRLDLDVMPKEAIREYLQRTEMLIRSSMGHELIARLVSEQLGISIPVNRISLELEPEDEMIVCQYCGPHIGRGVERLDVVTKIRYIYVTQR